MDGRREGNVDVADVGRSDGYRSRRAVIVGEFRRRGCGVVAAGVRPAFVNEVERVARAGCDRDLVQAIFRGEIAGVVEEAGAVGIDVDAVEGLGSRVCHGAADEDGERERNVLAGDVDGPNRDEAGFALVVGEARGAVVARRVGLIVQEQVVEVERVAAGGHRDRVGAVSRGLGRAVVVVVVGVDHDVLQRGAAGRRHLALDLGRKWEYDVLAREIHRTDGQHGRRARVVGEARGAVVARAVGAGPVLEGKRICARGNDDRVAAAAVRFAAVPFLGAVGEDIDARKRDPAALGHLAIDMDGKRQRDVGGHVGRGDHNLACWDLVVREARRAVVAAGVRSVVVIERDVVTTRSDGNRVSAVRQCVGVGVGIGVVTVNDIGVDFDASQRAAAAGHSARDVDGWRQGHVDGRVAAAGDRNDARGELGIREA